MAGLIIVFFNLLLSYWELTEAGPRPLKECNTAPLLSPYPDANPIVRTQYGEVMGKVLLSRSGREFDAYRGIPYAQPPVGKLRFKAPRLLKPWGYTLDATKDGPFCIQKNYFFANLKVEGQEDCLYLNVYVPKTAGLNNLLPVMVFIHWGDFFAGRGTSDYLGPEYFMDEDVILVTFNYRLGVLGFLTTNDDEAPGNYALKDQAAALKWVQENIKDFNGDSKRVTIFGQSAGGGSVHLHLLSPLSKGLFHQAISQSGSALALWAKPNNELQTNVTAAQALFVGCESFLGDSKKLIACLRKVDAKTLVNTGDLFKTFSIEPLTPYTLVSEKVTKRNPKPFITKDPLEYVKRGEFQKVPWIIGNVQDEGILRVGPILRQSNTREQFNASFTTLIPQIMGLALSVSPEEILGLQNNIIEFYFEGKHAVDVQNSKSVQKFIDLYSDRAFIYPGYQSAMLHSAMGHKPIWFYNFNYRGRISYGDLFAATKENINFDWGVSHCDDLIYLFKSPGLFSSQRNDLEIDSIWWTLLKMWTNFAINGNPDITEDFHWCPLNIPSFDDTKNKNFQFLNIAGDYRGEPTTFAMQNGFLKDRMHFWASKKLAENS